MWGKFLSDRKKRSNINLHYDENVIVAAESPSETVTDTARIIQFFGRLKTRGGVFDLRTAQPI